MTREVVLDRQYWQDGYDWIEECENTRGSVRMIEDKLYYAILEERPEYDIINHRTGVTITRWVRVPS